ncbi:helix-turn-helix transcriptional regulator [Dactylosporangium sp. NPDC006015]|uniref:helix-turn-helix domain-containing protein n=1 Tax=Dactylosporangium sp. NPDC006015 TaxID=3154576 RepID=UPI0033A35CB3
MVEEGNKSNPVGESVRANVRRLRAAKGYSYAELAERLEEIGWRIPVIGLRRIESGDRRVDVGDLMALAHVFNSSPLDLLVDPHADEGEVYQVTSSLVSTVESTREFIRGNQPLMDIANNSSPAASGWMSDFVTGLPPARGQKVWQKYIEQLRKDGDQ